MRIADMNWMQVEERVKRDDRCVLPIGSVEQHAYLSLCVDMILSEKVAVDAAAPLGVPVYPAVPFGLDAVFRRFSGHGDACASRPMWRCSTTFSKACTARASVAS